MVSAVVPAPTAPAAESVSLAPVPSVPPANVPVSSGAPVAPPGPSNASSSVSTAPVTAVANDAPASMPAVLERFDQIPRALWGIANRVLEEIDKAWAGAAYDDSYDNIAIGKDFLQMWKNYNKAQDALPSDKKVIQQLDQLIGICRFSAMMAVAFDHGIPMADVYAVGLETNEETE
ncbi:hypothetical protein MMC07_004817 [Pseudocyphellaria aurata]|nr:hypothetical protein [Pseudocyphellaria aurata]